MTKPSTPPAATEANMMRLVGAGILISVAALVVFHAAEFWAIPGVALVKFLTLQQLVPLSPDAALLMAHGMAGGWGLWLAVALVVYTLQDRHGTVNQAVMYFLVLVSLGVWFALLQLMVEQGVQGHWRWMSLPGALGVLLTTAAAIFFSGVHELGEDVDRTNSTLPGGRSGARADEVQA